MPKEIRTKLRQLRNANEKARKLSAEIDVLMGEYNVNTYYLRGLGELDDVQTEALTFIETCEGEVEKNIEEIEEVFLYYANQSEV